MQLKITSAYQCLSVVEANISDRNSVQCELSRIFAEPSIQFGDGLQVKYDIGKVF